MKQTQVIFLAASPEWRVCDLICAGVRRYAASRHWDVRFQSWKKEEVRSLRETVDFGHPLGFVVECGDGPLPIADYGDAPAVFVNCPAKPRVRRFAAIPIDHDAIGRAAFRELSLCRPSAYAVVGPRYVKDSWPTIRARAFRTAAAEAGAKCHVFAFKDPKCKYSAAEIERLSSWIKRLPRRTAVFAVNDVRAADVVEAARKARLRIPQDLTLLGVDNDPSICEMSKPPLSSIQVDFENAGYLAAKTLAGMIAAHDTSPRDLQDLHDLSDFQDFQDRENRVNAIGPLLAVRRESTRGFGRREPNILAAVEMIRREACDGLTPRELISRFPGSRWLFEMRFREAMGHSVLDEILHVRLERVCTLLATTDMPIKAISDFCGFNSGRSLREHFLSRMKTSLREFRARNRA